jgi:predicted lysophospholipase L1 biosynthesis ABC-type transport system permease subunit
MITVFMNTIMATIVAFLAILCAQLIYSLMLSDVEEKTYEFGMLRALGFNTSNLMATIIIQALTFAIPGLISGIVVAAVMNLGMRKVLYNLTNNTSTYELSKPSVIIGFCIGFFLPLISNIVPIQRALGKNLRASLDPYHRSAGEFLVQIKSLEKFGLSVNQLILASMLVILGVLTYYVAPASFLLGDYELFFGILNSLLLMMILGLTFISILLLPKVMRFWVRVFICCKPKDKNLKIIVMKNLKSHKKRNIKTAIMFAICLSFLIFAGSTFALIGNLIESTLET